MHTRHVVLAVQPTVRPGTSVESNRIGTDSPNMNEPFDPAAFAQRQLDAYNARDLERFIREYTDDVVVYRLPGAEPIMRGKQSLAEHYARNRFNLPELHAKLVNRMVFGNKVIDQEYVTGVPGAPLEVAAIYEVTPAGISTVWFVSG